MDNHTILILLSIINVGFIITFMAHVQSTMHYLSKHKDTDKMREQLHQHTMRYGLMVTILSIYLLYQWGKYSSEEYLSMPEEESTEVSE